MKASEIANLIQRGFHEAHRGALRVGDHVIVFGNDGYSGDRSAKELAIMREWLAARSFTEIDFGTDTDPNDEPYTWVLVLKAPLPVVALEAVENALWSAWHQACGNAAASVADGFYEYQAAIAAKVCESLQAAIA